VTGGGWTVRYEGGRPEAEGHHESLLALGNGRFVTRGAVEESVADGIHYPGTYVAGGYDELASEVAGRTVVNEDLVNFPNWLPLTFRPEDGEWLSPEGYAVFSQVRELSLREGLLRRRVRVRDAAGRETRVESVRLVHMEKPYLAAIEYLVTPLNWSGGIRIRSSLDGTVTNAGVARYRGLEGRHLEVVEFGPVAPEGVYLIARTRQSGFVVAQGARTRVFRGGSRAGDHHLLDGEEGRVGEEVRLEVGEGETVRVEKVVSLFTSRTPGAGEPGEEARRALSRAPEFTALEMAQRLAWQALWRKYDVEMVTRGPEGDRERLTLRLYVFHLLQTISPHSEGLDVGVPARGLHGEAYRGHVFWDELFIFPVLDLRAPTVARSLLLYRYHRLDAARALAAAEGYRGAMFPWQSGSDGEEETQRVHFNPLSGRWDPDHSRLQRHVNAAIVYNVWQYFRVTGDRTFLVDYGAEIVLEIARFWSSLATWRESDRRFEIVGVMGPDEYHEGYPGAAEGGLRNNAYTNVMAVWCLLRAFDVLKLVGPSHRAELTVRLGLGREEMERWDSISRRMYVAFHGPGLISQFEGYESLLEFPWEFYRAKYGDIQRLDRILKAEGDSPDRYRVSKQADVNMLFYLFESSELRSLFARLGYPLSTDALRANVAYYLDRTSHGSTLSKTVYASIVHLLDREAGWRLFVEALENDVDEARSGTTSEGIHLGAMGGTLEIVLRRYAGVKPTTRGLRLAPQLPDRLLRLRFRVRYRGRWLDVLVSHRRLVVRVDLDVVDPVPILLGDLRFEVPPGRMLRIPLRP